MFGLGRNIYASGFSCLFMIISLVTVGLFYIHVRGSRVFLSGKGSNDFSLVVDKLSLIYIYIY
jgi:hypothetical protein